MTEKQFQNQVRELALLLGWKYYHTWTSIRSAAGFPDVTLVRGERLVFAELKTDTGKLSHSQGEWLEALKSTKAEIYLWRPADFDKIMEVLR